MLSTVRNFFTSASGADECEKYYKFGKTLGQGSFATVKLATSKKDGSKWAVKIIKSGSLGPDDEAALRSEVDVLQKVSHKNIVILREVFKCPSHFYMVMEVCSGGELFDRITEKDHYTEEEARICLKQIAEGLEYIHAINVVHRDLKPENLLYSGPEEDATIKLADFGLAKLLDSQTMLHTACGTPGYVAPEVLMEKGYGTQVDMWSYGVIAYILLCGFPPFYDDNNSALYRAIKSGKYDYPSPFWDDVSSNAKSFVDALLVLDPAKRLTATQTLNHPFITQKIPKESQRENPHFKSCMKSYNGRRKFRAGIMSLQAISAMKSGVNAKGKGLLAAAAAAGGGDPAAAASAAAAPAAAAAGGGGAKEQPNMPALLEEVGVSSVALLGEEVSENL